LLPRSATATPRRWINTSKTSFPQSGAAYGLFNSGPGMAWFLSSALLGCLYDISLAGLIAFSVLAQVAAIALLMGVGRRVGVAPRA